MDFYNFCTVVSRKKHFIYTWQKCPPHLHNVLTLPGEKENIKFHTFIMHSLDIICYIKHGVKHKVHQVQRKQIDITKYVQNVRHWHEHKPQAHLLLVNCVINQWLVLSRATHAVDAVASHRCHELWSHTHVTDHSARHVATELTRPQSGVVDYAIWSVIQPAWCSVQYSKSAL